MTSPVSSREEIARLRAMVAETMGSRGPALAFGVDAIDVRLTDGGLDGHTLHEVTSASPALADEAAATLFLAGLAARFASDAGDVLWAASRFNLYAPGLEQAGLSPALLLFAEGRDDPEVLALAEDALRTGRLAAVVAEVRQAGMPATRRLQLAAAESRTPMLLFRHWRKRSACPLDEMSVAATRWRIGCARSAPLPYPGVGRACWTVELARQRGGNPFSLIVEACDETGRLALPAAAADRATASAGASARAA